MLMVGERGAHAESAVAVSVFWCSLAFSGRASLPGARLDLCVLKLRDMPVLFADGRQRVQAVPWRLLTSHLFFFICLFFVLIVIATIIYYIAVFFWSSLSSSLSSLSCSYPSSSRSSSRR